MNNFYQLIINALLCEGVLCREFHDIDELFKGMKVHGNLEFFHSRTSAILISFSYCFFFV